MILFNGAPFQNGNLTFTTLGDLPLECYHFFTHCAQLCNWSYAPVYQFLPTAKARTKYHIGITLHCTKQTIPAIISQVLRRVYYLRGEVCWGTTIIWKTDPSEIERTCQYENSWLHVIESTTSATTHMLLEPA